MKESIIIIDSSKRNTTLYPVNNSFKYNTNKTYSNPTKISLLSAIICNSQYVINSNNNLFNLTYSSTLYTATIPQSNYTPSSLSTALQTALNGLSVPSTTFTVSVNLNTMQFTITSTNAVVYNFSLNTQLSQILGFQVTNSTSTTSITSTNTYTINTTRYYKLFIREFNNNYDTNISNSFNFLILNNVNSGEYLYLTDINNVNNTHEINIRNININTLTIELRDEWDNLVLLNGNDFVLIFKIYE